MGWSYSKERCCRDESKCPCIRFERACSRGRLLHLPRELVKHVVEVGELETSRVRHVHVIHLMRITFSPALVVRVRRTVAQRKSALSIHALL